MYGKLDWKGEKFSKEKLEEWKIRYRESKKFNKQKI